MPIGDLNIARPLYSTAAASKETKGLGNRVFHDTTTTTTKEKKVEINKPPPLLGQLSGERVG